MLKCTICGYEFPATYREHYIARDIGKSGLIASFGAEPEERLYDAFDCPVCHSQIVAQERKRVYSLAKYSKDEGVSNDAES